jgi:methionine-rich copper-binding protein CopC
MLGTTAMAAFALLHAAPVSGAARRHTHLIKSVPAANDSLRVAPKDLRFTFEGKIDITVSSVKVTTAAGAAVPIGKLSVLDSGDDAILVAPSLKPLTPGSYNVAWATASMHGHDAKGKFRFTIRPAPAKAG